MTKFEELKLKLAELFELDKADLDFGIHRIIKVKHAQITGYLITRLPAKVSETLGQVESEISSAQLEELKVQIRKAISDDAVAEDGTLSDDAKDTNLGKQYLEAVKGLATDKERVRTENEIYSHLYEFFSRYYEEGDFISQRRRTAGKESYAIPYDGEEVILHWANRDQYYIKSTEDLKDYTFTVGDYRVKFKLTKMDAVQNNNKASRIFQIDEESEIEAEENQLVVPFHFAEGKKRNKGETGEWEEAVLNVLPEEWQKRLAAKDETFTGDGERTILEKHLRNYTRKNTSDYFIHKDLGGFLRRELDFYIKNELMHLDDVDSRPADYLEAEIRKIKAIRIVAHDLIDFLAQFENFQKKLWLKKKFVVETNWCITLDRIPEEFYEEIAANDEQRKEWVKLFAIDEITEDSTDGEAPAYSEPLTVEFLRANEKLVLDTSFLGENSRRRLIGDLKEIDEQCAGILVEGNNFQALGLLRERFNESVRSIYIDPPYNTGSDGFIYRDSYQHSTWLSALTQLLEASYGLLTESAGYSCNLNDIEDWRMRGLIEVVMGNQSYVTTVVTKCSTASSFRTVNTGPVDVTDRIVLFSKVRDKFNYSPQPVKKTLDLQHFSRFIVNFEESPSKWEFRPIRLEVLNRLGFDCDSTAKGMRQARDKWGEAAGAIVKSEATRFAIENAHRVFETKTLQKPSTWLKEYIARSKKLKGKIVVADREEKDSILLLNGRQFYFLEKNIVAISGQKVVTEPASTLWTDIDTNNLKHEGGIDFPNGKKPLKLVKRLIRMSDSSRGEVVLDYFAGSGTTGHAVISANRESQLNLKFILVEDEAYFHSVTTARIKKALYCDVWYKGRATSRDAGTSGLVKYIRLESYEDALNNLELENRSADLQGLSESVQEDYLLRYSLEFETRKSLLNLERFEDPFNATLKVYNRETGEAEPKRIDLPETFNYLLGLRVRTMKMYGNVLVIEGENPADEKVMVVWRNVKETENAALEEFFEKELKVDPAKTELAAVYVNGDTTLIDPHNKVILTEKVFHELMFEDTE